MRQSSHQIELPFHQLHVHRLPLQLILAHYFAFELLVRAVVLYYFDWAEVALGDVLSQHVPLQYVHVLELLVLVQAERPLPCYLGAIAVGATVVYSGDVLL